MMASLGVDEMLHIDMIPWNFGNYYLKYLDLIVSYLLVQIVKKNDVRVYKQSLCFAVKNNFENQQ